MKAIRTFLFVVIPLVCAACATQHPRTISALPEPPTARDLQQFQRLPNGNYPGYQRIMVNGQEQFCRQKSGFFVNGAVQDVSGGLRALTDAVATRDGLSESRVVCLTEAQVRTERLLALEQAQLLQRQLQQQQALWYLNSGWPTTDMNAQQMVANVPAQR